MRAMDVGTVADHDAIRHVGDGATTDVMMIGDAIAGGTDWAIGVGGPSTTVGEMTTGAIGGATTVGVIDVTVAIDSCAEFIIGIAGDKLSQLRDMNAGPS